MKNFVFALVAMLFISTYAKACESMVFAPSAACAPVAFAPAVQYAPAVAFAPAAVQYAPVFAPAVQYAPVFAPAFEVQPVCHIRAAAAVRQKAPRAPRQVVRQRQVIRNR